jgi:hypothetical protein
VGLVVSSCACTEITEVTTIINKALIRSESRCMVVCSNLSIRLASGWTAAISLLPVFYKNTAKNFVTAAN